MTRRGMTLIELLIALTLLAMMSLLAAVMWTQLRDWNTDAVAAESALRPQRVHMMLRRQWEHRAAAHAEGSIGSVETTWRSLRFLTHAPVLHPAWPLVRAEYTIAPVDLADPEGPLELLYTETRLGPDSVAISEPPLPPLVLLTRCDSAELRVFVQPEDESEEPAPPFWTLRPDTDALGEVTPLIAEFNLRRRGERITWTGIVEPSR